MSLNPESDLTANTPVSLAATPTVAAVATLLDPVAVHRALGDRTRYAVVRELATGAALPVTELARRLKRPRAVVSRHLAVLLAAGVVTVQQDRQGDGRQRLYAIPAPCRRAPEAGQVLVDYGLCLVRFP